MASREDHPLAPSGPVPTHGHLGSGLPPRLAPVAGYGDDRYAAAPSLRLRQPVPRCSPYGEGMARYRFLDGMGDVMDERDFPGHAAALAWARDEEELDAEVQRVEYLGPEGDWRWAGALGG